jgi:hypothetical protein
MKRCGGFRIELRSECPGWQQAESFSISSHVSDELWACALLENRMLPSNRLVAAAP